MRMEILQGGNANIVPPSPTSSTPKHTGIGDSSRQIEAPTMIKKNPPPRAKSPMRAVRDRNDKYCVRIVDVPPTVTLTALRDHAIEFNPVLTYMVAKDVFEARFATEEDGMRYQEKFDWQKVKRQD